MNELIGVVTPDNTYNLSGQISGESALSGIVTGGAQYEAYSGSYQVTPSGSTQTLETDGKLMTDDVTVSAIADDYVGTAIPRRTGITVNSDSNIINVAEGYYQYAISSAMEPCTVGGVSVSIDSQGDASGAITVSEGGHIAVGTYPFQDTGVVTPRSSSDLTASGATVSVPSGYYSSAASKAVASGSAGTPTATKGSVSNHAVDITPSVTNTTGYITGGTKTGTAVSVSASELVSGTKSITANGTGIDVTDYQKVNVSVSAPSPTLETVTKTYTPTESQQTETITPSSGYDGIGEVDVTVNAVSSSYVGSGVSRKTSSDLTVLGATVTAPAGYYESAASKAVAGGTEGTPTATKGAVSNHSVSVTPSVTNTTGYITGGTKTGTAVSVSASELVSGNKAITDNGTGIDVANYSTVSVDVPSLDISDTTAEAADVASGKYFYTAGGVKTAGTASGSSAQDFINLMATQDFPSGEIVITDVTQLSLWAFQSRRKITKVYSTSLTSLNNANYAFNGCVELKEVNFPNVTTASAGGYQFADTGSGGLEKVSLPKLTTASTNFFYNQQKLTSVDVSLLTAIPANCFQQCYALEMLDLPKVTSIANNGFFNCRKLTTLILRSTTVVSIANNTVLNNSPFKGYNGLTGTLYVPQSLISSYQTGTNWSDIYAAGYMTISKIEGSVYE